MGNLFSFEGYYNDKIKHVVLFGIILEVSDEENSKKAGENYHISISEVKDVSRIKSLVINRSLFMLNPWDLDIVKENLQKILFEQLIFSNDILSYRDMSSVRVKEILDENLKKAEIEK